MIEHKMHRYKVRKVVNGSIRDETPLFFNDNKVLLVPSDNSVYLYNTTTGHKLSYQIDCENQVVGLQMHSLHPNKILIYTKIGEIMVYAKHMDYVEEMKVKLNVDLKFLNSASETVYADAGPKKFDAQERIIYHHFHSVLDESTNSMNVLASWSLKRETMAHLSYFNLKNGCMFKRQFPKAILQKKEYNFVVLSNNVIVTMGDTFVTLYRLNDKILKYTMHSLGHKQVTCLAAHPTALSFATGDKSGKVMLWNNIFTKSPIKTTYHWHALPVHCILFSQDASHLYTGGEENVLVKWSLHSNHKNFLPRLSAPILHLAIGINNTHLSVSTLDNRLVVMDSNFHCIATIQHFSSWSSFHPRTNRNCVCEFDARSSSLIMNGRAGHIQMLSVNDEGRFLYTLDVTNKNIVSSANTSPHVVDVTLVKTSVCGKWLVTFEVLNENNVYSESRLKFWKLDEIKQQFSLNTDVATPHEENMFALEYASSDDLVLTTGSDLTCKFWAPMEEYNAWSCFGIGKYKSLLPGPASFSCDGSLVAVGFGPSLTLWDTTSCILKSSLTSCLDRQRVQMVKFGNMECSHLVVSTTETCITSWNVVSLTKMWTVSIRAEILVSDPTSSLMAVFSSNNGLFLFKPTQPNPEFQTKNCSESSVKCASWVQRPYNGSNIHNTFQLYFFNSSEELLCLDEETELIEEEQMNESVEKTQFARLMPERQKTDVKKNSFNHIIPAQDKKLNTLLISAPSYTLPPVSLYCCNFLKQLSVKQSQRITTKPDNSHHQLIKEIPDSIAEANTETDNLNIIFEKLFNSR